MRASGRSGHQALPHASARGSGRRGQAAIRCCGSSPGICTATCCRRRAGAVAVSGAGWRWCRPGALSMCRRPGSCGGVLSQGLGSQQVHSPRSTVHGPQSTVHGPRSTVHSPQSAVHSPQSTVQSPQCTSRRRQCTGARTGDSGFGTQDLRHKTRDSRRSSRVPAALGLLSRLLCVGDRAVPARQWVRGAAPAQRRQGQYDPESRRA